MNSKYKLLPFRFEKFNRNYLITNDVGDYHLLSEETFRSFINHNLITENKDYYDLKSKSFLCDNSLDQNLNLLATRYRTKKRFLYDFTSLHMVVVTRRCNQNCIYCHASSLDEKLGSEYDMTFETASKTVDYILNSPSKNIKIEFQGGEPLLNFEIIKLIYKLVTDRNVNKKEIAFVICTNLLKINKDILNFISSNNISISTSLDGPRDLHDSCRLKRNGSGTHDHFIKSLREVSFLIPRENISALVTVTRFNINNLEAVIDEYVALGFRSIFLRNLNQFGAAHNNWVKVGYSIDTWVKAYSSAIDYIIQLNLSGKHFSEEYAALLLTRILTPFSTGFVDLQSPSGAGISGVLYDYNGDVYVSDEGRMLSAFTGDKKFCIGNVHRGSYKDIFCGSALNEIVSKTTIESIPGCAWCVYQPYCGSDPVKNYSESGNLVGNRPTSEFCAKQKAIFRILFEYILSENEDVNDVFWSWITGRDVTEIRKPYISH